VLRESLDDSLHHLLPWDIELIIDEPVDEPEEEPEVKFKIALFLLIPSSSVEGRDTCMDLENFYVTPCFSHDYHLMLVEYIKPQNTESACTTREKETDRNTFF
jgi:hypothetical protein